MNVLITAGGNTEKIDDVRAIRNTGTGRLGSLVAGKLAAAGARIFYVCDRRAVIPQAQGIEVMGADNMDARTQGVEIINADDVTELEAAVRTACTEHRIDAVVHSMAVSDYRVKNVTTSKDAACSVAAAISEGESGLRVAGASHRGDAVESYTAQQAAFTAGMISRAITAAAPVNGKGKISSDNEDLLVVLERAPKIISMLRPLAPDAVIVGFKLLSGASEQELARVGLDLLKRNDCDYVLANDMESLRGGEHTGHLIARDGSYTTYRGKEAIADAIAAAVRKEAR